MRLAHHSSTPKKQKSFLHGHQTHAYNPHTFAAGVFRETLSGQVEGGDWP